MVGEIGIAGIEGEFRWITCQIRATADLLKNGSPLTSYLSRCPYGRAELGAVSNPAGYIKLHVWWARRPLIAISRAAIAGSLLKSNMPITKSLILIALGTSRRGLVLEQRRHNGLQSRLGESWLERQGFSNERGLSSINPNGFSESKWLRDNLASQMTL